MRGGYIILGSIAAVLVIVAALLLINTSGSRQETVTGTPPQTLITTTTGVEKTEHTATAGEERIVSFTLYLWDYGFNASRGGPTLIVNVGDRVRLNLVGNGSGPIVHDFVLDKDSPSPYNVRSNRLARGETQVIEFVATYPGTFKYYCSVAPPFGQSHRERGQEGTIIVLER